MQTEMCVISFAAQKGGVSFAAQKGGVGKTTLAGHVAVAAHLAGMGPVGLIDMDPQGSLIKWWEGRCIERLSSFHSEQGSIAQALREAAAAGMGLVIVDIPPAITRAISDVVAQSDMVVVPTRPSPHDLRTVGLTVDIAEWHEKPLVFVGNGAAARARITSDAAVALSQHRTVAPVTIYHRVDFAVSMIDGRTVIERRRSRPPRIKVSLRLERHRHDRLKAAALLQTRTHQDLITTALDCYFDRMNISEMGVASHFPKRT